MHKNDNCKAKIFARVIWRLFTKGDFRLKVRFLHISGGSEGVKNWLKLISEDTFVIKIFHFEQLLLKPLFDLKPLSSTLFSKMTHFSWYCRLRVWLVIPRKKLFWHFCCKILSPKLVILCTFLISCNRKLEIMIFWNL